MRLVIAGVAGERKPKCLKVFATPESKAKKGRNSQILWNLRSGRISILFSSNLRYSSAQSLEIKLTIVTNLPKKLRPR
jgi:hypothetical protein